MARHRARCGRGQGGERRVFRCAPETGGSQTLIPAFERVLAAVPRIAGAPIHVRVGHGLMVKRGKLLFGGASGVPVHAGSFLRERKLVLDRALLSQPGELRRILAHELFHFVWVRLSNAVRREFEDLLAGEIRRGARGELGWSAERRKDAIAPGDLRCRSRKWREYVCESFCDTAAWVYLARRRHSEHTLARRWRDARRRWFQAAIAPPLRA